MQKTQCVVSVMHEAHHFGFCDADSAIFDFCTTGITTFGFCDEEDTTLSF